MATILPLPTLILLRVSGFIQDYWFPACWAAGRGHRRCALVFAHAARRGEVGQVKIGGCRSLGRVYRSAALSRFARTLGTLAKSGVSLLPALKIVENTIGNLVLGK